MTSQIWSHTPVLVFAAFLGSAVPVAAQGTGYGYAPPGYNYGNDPNGNAAPRDVAWCEQRYRSFNRATGTYLGYDGRQHACPNRGAPSANQGSVAGYVPPPYYGYGYAPSYSYGYPYNGNGYAPPYAYGYSYNGNGYPPASYGYPAPGYARPPGVLPRDRLASPGRGDPDRTWQNATTEPF
jgi:hypothetical protein